MTEAQTCPGMVIGTIAYMSPEQASGKPLDGRSDIFSFGVVLYELLAGRHPFRGATVPESLQNITNAPPQPLGLELPDTFRRIVGKALAKNPAERYQSMREMVTDLRSLLRHSTGETPVRHNRPWLAAAAVCVIAALLAVGTWRFLTRTSTIQIRSIAVLPLRNLSNDPNQEYFSDGTTEALISDLAQIHSVKTVSRISVMRYKGTIKPLPEIARELGVDAVVEGSWQPLGERVRITAQLIRASTDAHLWAKDYERDMSDVLRLEAEVAREIAHEIGAQITPEEARRLNRARSVKPVAQDRYLLGRQYLWSPNASDRRRAVGYFRQAIQIQPDYAAPYAELALTWHLVEATGVVRPPEIESEARAAALKALELDPDLAEAHGALAGIKWFEDWDWAGAEREFRKALELNPDSMDVCNCYSAFLWAAGRGPEAIAAASDAIRADPFASAGYLMLGRALYGAQRFEEAIPQLRRALELNPQNRNASVYLAKIYEQTGRLQEALAVLERPEFRPSPDLALAYALLGRRAEARKMLEPVAELGADRYAISLAYFALGDKDTAFRWLTRAFDERQVFVNFARFDPQFKSVRSDLRFQKLIARLHEP